MSDNLKQLEVNDVIFSYRRGKITSRQKVTRVTPKFAFVGNTKYRRDVMGDKVRSFSNDPWSVTDHYISTPEREKEFEKSRLVYKIKNFDLSKLNDCSYEYLQDLYLMMNKAK